MGSTIYITIYSVIKENNNCYWSAILTLDKAALEAALPLYTEWRASIVAGAGAGASVSSARQFRFETRHTHSLARGLQHQQKHQHQHKHKRSPQSMAGMRDLRQLVARRKHQTKCFSVCVCVCVCVGVNLLLYCLVTGASEQCLHSVWVRESATASGSGRGTGRASTRRVFVEFLFWHLTEDAAATPMRRLSDKICCCCSSLLPPPSLSSLTFAHCVCVFAHVVEIVLCSCCAFCLTILCLSCVPFLPSQR